MSKDNKKESLLERLGESQVWKSIIRSGVPRSRRQRMYAVLGNVFLHLHPARLPKHAVKIGYTWCMGGLSFFLFVVLTGAELTVVFSKNKLWRIPKNRLRSNNIWRTYTAWANFFRTIFRIIF